MFGERPSKKSGIPQSPPPPQQGTSSTQPPTPGTQDKPMDTPDPPSTGTPKENLGGATSSPQSPTTEPQEDEPMVTPDLPSTGTPKENLGGATSSPQSPTTEPQEDEPMVTPDLPSTGTPKENLWKKHGGSAMYGCTFKKEWTKEWTFITPSNDPYSYHCVICGQDVSCKHQGRRDVERHLESSLHKSRAAQLKQSKLAFAAVPSGPLAEKVCTFKRYVVQKRKSYFDAVNLKLRFPRQNMNHYKWCTNAAIMLLSTVHELMYYLSFIHPSIHDLCS